MKYYLLQYNEDFADEMNVPALACFTEEEYNKWLELPVGKPNLDYDKQLENYNKYKEAESEIINKLKSILSSNWQCIPFDKWPKDLYNEYEQLPKKFGYNYSRYNINYPVKSTYSYIRDYLGNWGEGFEECFYYYSIMKDMVDDKSVKVSEVSKEFYDTFHQNGLSSLSLCNIFDIERIIENIEYEEL